MRLRAGNAARPRGRADILDLGAKEVGIDAFHHLAYAGAAHVLLDR